MLKIFINIYVRGERKMNNLRRFIEKAKVLDGKEKIDMIYDMSDKVYLTYYLNGKLQEKQLIGGFITAVTGKLNGKDKVVITISYRDGRVIKMFAEDIIEIIE